MAREKAFHDRAEQKRAPTLKSKLIHFEIDFDTASICKRAGQRQASDCRTGANAAHALDLLSAAPVGTSRIELQHLSQRCGAFRIARVEQRQVVERQVADKAPREGPFAERRSGSRRTFDAAD